jgi:hypothetical protein
VGTLNTIGRQKIKTTGTATAVQQTQASKDAAPPVVPGMVTQGEVIRGVVMIVGMILCVVGFFNDSIIVAVLGAAAILFSFCVPVAATGEELANHRQATKHSQAARDAWEKTFKCSSCGHKFVPSEVNAV